jgi:protein O-GlcNAc transferase
LPKDAQWPDPLLQETQALAVGWHARFLNAEHLHRAGRLPESVEMFRALVRERPADSRAPVKLGMVLTEMQDYAGAEAVLRQAIALDPNKVQAHFFLSAALFHQAERKDADPARARQQFEDAAQEARRTLDLQPTHAFAFVYLGLSLKHLGRADEALAALENAVRCGPESVDPHLHLGEALLEAGRREDGVRQLEDAVRVAPASDNRPRLALERLQKKEKN